ncbi:MAG: glycosyltransferase family 4 protein [Magnetococcales bacterium]|nr:glycosyltransferase family 4 protein [Magnetococcales bacterium]
MGESITVGVMGCTESDTLHVLVVCHTAYPQVRGGIDAMLQALIDALPPPHRISLFAPGDWSANALETRRTGKVTSHRLRLRLPGDARRPLRGLLGWLREFPVTLWRLRRLMRAEGIDLIHLHTVRDFHIYFRVLRWLGGPPYLLTFHGTDALNFAQGTLLGVKGERRVSPLLHWVACGAGAVTAVAAHYARLIERHHPHLAPVRHIPNGIPLTPAPATSPPGEWPDRFWLVAGWVEPPKAPDAAVRAWGRLHRQFPDLHLLIVGDVPLMGDGAPFYPGYREELSALIAQEGVAERVRLTGALPRDHLAALMRRARGLLFPSLREGLPYVLLEAGLAGLPVVCHDIPAFADVVSHGEEGLLVPGGDPEAMAAAVARLTGDPDLAGRMGQALRAKIAREYSAQVMANRYLELYASLVAS